MIFLNLLSLVNNCTLALPLPLILLIDGGR